MFDVGVGVCIFGSLGLRQRGGTRRRYAFLRGRGRARGSRSRWGGGGGAAHQRLCPRNGTGCAGQPLN
jgi:hypothetical protein